MAKQMTENIQTALANAVGSLLQTDSKIDLRDRDVAVIDYKMVTFSLGGKDYGIDIMNVKEIVKTGSFTYVPNTMPFVRGVYNLRGDIIPIIDFRIFFGIPITDKKEDGLENLLIVTVEDQTFGVIVDEVDSVVGIEKRTIQPPHPIFGEINIKYIFGVVEANKHLYILLNINMFTSSNSSNEKNVKGVSAYSVPDQIEEQGGALQRNSLAVDSSNVNVENDKDYVFIVSSLADLKKFYVTEINAQWVKSRFAEWIKMKGKDNNQLQSAVDADEFLQPFWSQNSNTWWPESYANAVYKLLPDNSAKQIYIWNPGCGKGCETYSLACLLKKRYPNAKVRIYAHDIDLLTVSNAPLLTVPEEVANTWYAPYITKTIGGEYAFKQEIKDIAMFEYHDCTNTNAIPVVDIVFARDILSFMPKKVLDAVLADFEEKVKGNGVVILGENESLASRVSWGEKMIDSLTVYSKQ